MTTVYPRFKEKPIRLKGSKLKKLKESCIKRDKVCLYSGSPFNLQVHHIIPLGRGGSDTMKNLATVNAEIHDKIHKEWLNVSGIAPDELTWVEKK